MANEPNAVDPIAAPTRDVRLRRLRVRCWRRGTREMDLLLGGFCDAAAAALSDSALTDFERLAQLDDTQVYAWILGSEPAPSEFAALIRRIRDAAASNGTERT